MVQIEVDQRQQQQQSTGCNAMDNYFMMPRIGLLNYIIIIIMIRDLVGIGGKL